MICLYLNNESQLFHVLDQTSRQFDLTTLITDEVHLRILNLCLYKSSKKLFFQLLLAASVTAVGLLGAAGLASEEAQVQSDMYAKMDRASENFNAIAAQLDTAEEKTNILCPVIRSEDLNAAD